MINLVEEVRVKDLKFFRSELSNGEMATHETVVIEIDLEEDANYLGTSRPNYFTSTSITDEDGTIVVGFAKETYSCQGYYDGQNGCDVDDTYFYECFEFDIRKFGELPIRELKEFMLFMDKYQKVVTLAEKELTFFKSIDLMKAELNELKQSKYFDLTTELVSSRSRVWQR